MTVDFGETLRDMMAPRGTPEQQACSHALSTEMPDGKFYCPSCRLVSSLPLVTR